MTDKELTEWEHQPHVITVLTSREMGAWLGRRDSRRDSRILQEILLEIADIDGYEDRYSMLHDRPSLVKKVRNDCLEIIDKHIKEYTE